jgi:hypothetical protein
MPNYPKIIIVESNNTNTTSEIINALNNEELYDASNNSESINEDNNIKELTKRVHDLESKKKFMISNLPKGALVKYDEKEIRIMCPINAEWKLHPGVGPNPDHNMHYMGFKAYAPEGAVGFKEGDHGFIVDEMFTFKDDFAGTDEYGNYSICWFAIAYYNKYNDIWTYFGSDSTVKKYVGWDYVIEWYDVDGNVISSDTIRINLSNEKCHLINEPYYVSKLTAEIEEIKNKLK